MNHKGHRGKLYYILNKLKKRAIANAWLCAILLLFGGCIASDPNDFLTFSTAGGGHLHTYFGLSTALHFYSLFGADINKIYTSHYGLPRYTLVDKAVDTDDVKMLRVLLDFGADPNISGLGNGSTPIMLACDTDPAAGEGQWVFNRQMTRLLLEHGADPYRKRNDGKNAFDIAKNPQIIKMLKTVPRR